MAFGIRINGFISELEQRETIKRKKRSGRGKNEGEGKRKKNKNKKDSKRAPLAENINIEDLSN